VIWQQALGEHPAALPLLFLLQEFNYPLVQGWEHERTEVPIGLDGDAARLRSDPDRVRGRGVGFCEVDTA
jgi:hypothetical protein